MWSETHYETDYALRCALEALAYNLAIAAGLCRAFSLGKAYGVEHTVAGWNGGGWTYPFEPGCGRSAP